MIGDRVLFEMGLMYRIFPEFLNEYALPPKESLGQDVDSAWQQFLSRIDNNKKVARYINAGICAILKFSNTRTTIVLDSNNNKQVQ